MVSRTNNPKAYVRTYVYHELFLMEKRQSYCNDIELRGARSVGNKFQYSYKPPGTYRRGGRFCPESAIVPNPEEKKQGNATTSRRGERDGPGKGKRKKRRGIHANTEVETVKARVRANGAASPNRWTRGRA